VYFIKRTSHQKMFQTKSAGVSGIYAAFVMYNSYCVMNQFW